MLSKGSVSAMYNGNEPPSPLVQIIKIAPVQSVSQRYKIFLSDGDHCIQASVTTQLNPNFESGAFQTGTVVKLDEYICNEVQNKKLLVVMQMTSMGPPVPMIGNPINKNAEDSQQAGPPAQQSNTQQQSFVPKTDPVPSVQAPHNQQANTFQRPQLASSAIQAVSKPFTSGPASELRPPNQPLVAQPSTSRPLPSNATLAPDGSPIFQLTHLTPYNNRWTVRARVTHKSPIKLYENARGKGRLFSVELLDESGEMRCTMFNEALDTFYPLFQAGQVYYISKGLVKAEKGDRKYSSINNSYEMSLNSNSIVTPCADDASVPQLNVAAVPLDQIAQYAPEDIIDIIAILVNVGELGEIITKKDNRQLAKRVLTLADDTGVSLDLTLWGDTATNFQSEGNPVTVVKSVRISDFGGRSLNATNNSYFVLDPETERSHQLRAWWNHQQALHGGRVPLTPLTHAANAANDFSKTPTKTMQQARDEQLGKGEQATFFVAPCTVMQVKHDENAPLYYTACPTPNCYKKVTQNERNMWYCIKCNKEYDHNDARYILSLLLADSTGSAWVNAFNAEGQQLIGYDANDIRILRERGDPNLHLIFDEVLFGRYTFKMKAQEEMYNEEMKFRCTIVGVQPFDYATDSRRLVDKIREFV